MRVDDEPYRLVRQLGDDLTDRLRERGILIVDEENAVLPDGKGKIATAPGHEVQPVGHLLRAHGHCLFREYGAGAGRLLVRHCRRGGGHQQAG